MASVLVELKDRVWVESLVKMLEKCRNCLVRVYQKPSVVLGSQSVVKGYGEILRKV